MIMWLVEMFLNLIGVYYVTICAMMMDGACRKAAEWFILANSKCNVLLTLYQCGAHSLNLYS
jgi:hypothetical protein